MAPQEGFLPDDPRHLTLVRYFEGHYPLVHTPVVLEGPPRSVRSVMARYMALYRDPDRMLACIYARILPNQPSAQEAAEELGRLRLPALPMVSIAVGTPEEVERLALLAAEQIVGNLELPLVFVAWLQVLATEETKIVLFFPRGTPPDLMFNRLKESAMRAYGA